MPADVQISRVFSFLDGLMMCARFANASCCVRMLFVQMLVARFVFAAHFRDIFFDGGQFGFGRGSFSFASRQASALPSRARTSSARSSGKRARRAPIAARFAFPNRPAAELDACSADNFFSRSRSAASFS